MQTMAEGLAKHIPRGAVVEEVVFQHGLDAAFLWNQRNRAARARDYRFAELAALDDQLAAHLRGIALAGPSGLEICGGVLGDDPGDMFVLASLAAGLGVGALEAAIGAAADAEDSGAGVAAALEWLPLAVAEPFLRRWSTTERVGLRRIALRAAIAHRCDVGSWLLAEAAGDDATMRALALKGAGDHGREELVLHAQRHWHDDDQAVAYLARRASLVLGGPEAAAAMAELIVPGGQHAEEACALVMRHVPPQTAGEWHRYLTASADRMGLAVVAAGASGDPGYVPWLLEVMDEPPLARPAADAVTSITGLDLEDQGLEGDAPEGFNEGPTQDPDDADVAIPADSDVEWPDVKAVRSWWREHGGDYPPGIPLIAGRPRDRDGRRHVLLHGSQRMRHAAAFDLAVHQRVPLGQARAAVFPAAAPAPRQRTLLAQYGLVARGSR